MTDIDFRSIGYTSGPWTCNGKVKPVGDQNSLSMLWCGEISPKHEIGKYRGDIATIQSCDHIQHGISREEAAANARLIAALPDLVEALQEAREFIDGQIDVVDGSYGESSPNRAMSLARQIDEALGKAGAA
jgi:hypothetical protein